MRVYELRALLAALPDNMLITVNGKHVELVERRFQNRGVGLRSVPCACPSCDNEHSTFAAAEYHWPERLEIGQRSNAPLGRDPEPSVAYLGRWTKAMRETIDALREDPYA